MKKTCTKCKREYDVDASLCFRCGISLNPDKPTLEKQVTPRKLNTAGFNPPIGLQRNPIATENETISSPQNKPLKGPPTAPRTNLQSSQSRSQNTTQNINATQTQPSFTKQSQNPTLNKSTSVSANLPPAYRRPLPVPKPRATTTTSTPSSSSQISPQLELSTLNQVNSQGNNSPHFDKASFDSSQQQHSSQQQQQQQQHQSTTSSFEAFHPIASFETEEYFKTTPIVSIQQQLPVASFEQTQAPDDSWIYTNSPQAIYGQQNAFQQQQDQQQDQQQQQYYGEMKDTTSPFQGQESFTPPYNEQNPSVFQQQQQTQQYPVAYEKVQPVQQQPYYYNEVSTPSPTQPQPTYPIQQQQQQQQQSPFNTTPTLPYQKTMSTQNQPAMNASPYFFPLSKTEMSLHHHHGNHHERKARNFFSFKSNRQDPKSSSKNPLIIPTHNAPIYSQGNFENSTQLAPIATEFPTQLSNKPQKLWPHEEAAMAKYNQQQNKVSPNQRTQIKRLQGLWDCSAEREGDLEFEFGDIIYVLREEDSGWWKGQLDKNGNIGVFPVNYTAECNY